MVIAWEMPLVWPAVDEPPNRAHLLPLRDVPPVVPQVFVSHSGELASVQLGLLSGLPVAASKPPSWISSAAVAGPVRNGTSTSPDVTSSVLQAADSRLNADMSLF